MNTDFTDQRSISLWNWGKLFLLSLVSVLALGFLLRLFGFKLLSREQFGVLMSASFILVSIKAFYDLDINLRQAFHYYNKRVGASFTSGLKYFIILPCFIVAAVMLVGSVDFLLSYFKLAPADALANSLIPESFAPSHTGAALLGSTRKILVFIFASCVLAPIGEELIFRRLLYASLRNKYGFPVSLAVSAFAFAAFHGGGWFIAFGNGLLIGYLYERTHDVLAAIFLHSFINVLALILGLVALRV